MMNGLNRASLLLAGYIERSQGGLPAQLVTRCRYSLVLVLNIRTCVCYILAGLLNPQGA